MQTNANNQGAEIKKVLLRKDGLKFVVIPRKSNIEAGDFILIKKIAEVGNA